MPFISIKARPRPKEAQIEAVEKLTEALKDVWGCPQESITVLFETVTAEDWQEKVDAKEIEPHEDLIMILHGQKKY